MRFYPLSVILLGLAWTSVNASADVLRVPFQYGYIQDALNAAQPGDVIVIPPGTYLENLVWPPTQGITLLSEAGPEVTVIQGVTQGARVISITVGVGTDTVIEGFTIRGGQAAYGAGILCSGSSPTVRGNVIRDNTGGDGAGIACRNESHPMITGNRIEHNIGDWGAGIYVAGGSNPMISNNDLIDNTAPFPTGIGGAIHTDYSSPTIDGNRIIGNSTWYEAGGVYCCHGAPVLTGNWVEGNSAYVRGGGIFIC